MAISERRREMKRRRQRREKRSRCRLQEKINGRRSTDPQGEAPGDETNQQPKDPVEE